MKNLLKWLLAFTCLIFLAGCSNDDNSNDADKPNGIKYIKTITDHFGNSENWIYDDQNRVVKILYSKDRATMFEYDNEGRVTNVNTFLRSAPGIKTEKYKVEYEQNLITVTVNRLEANPVITEVREYTLDGTGKPIKEKISGNGLTERVYTRNDGNVINVNGFGPEKYTYDDKKNVYYYYPIGLRLVLSESLINDNNITKAVIGNQEYISKYEYDSEGYVTKGGAYAYTY